MDKVGDIFTALPFSNSVLGALKLVAAAAAMSSHTEKGWLVLVDK